MLRLFPVPESAERLLVLFLECIPEFGMRSRPVTSFVGLFFKVKDD